MHKMQPEIPSLSWLVKIDIYFSTFNRIQDIIMELELEVPKKYIISWNDYIQ